MVAIAAQLPFSSHSYSPPVRLARPCTTLQQCSVPEQGLAGMQKRNPGA